MGTDHEGGRNPSMSAAHAICANPIDYACISPPSIHLVVLKLQFFPRQSDLNSQCQICSVLLTLGNV